MAETRTALSKMEAAESELVWNRETVPKVLKIVSTRLSQRDLVSLLLVSPWLYRSLVSYPSIWLSLDFSEMGNAGNRLVAALSLPRYCYVKQIKLEFAQDIEDKHLELLKIKCLDSLQNLECLNLNGCQKISDKGIEAITNACPMLKVFSIYWNVRITDMGIKHLVKNCKYVTELNLSGCKNISDKSLQLVAENYPKLELLNLTSFTDEAYKSISFLTQLKFLDLCGAQNLLDEGLACVAKCVNLVCLNLTWCIRVTDVGVICIAQGCTSLEFLSLFGIVGVTDKCLEALSRSCSNTITTLDVNGCIGIKRRSRDELLHLFPHLKCFKVHS
ncbi:F-box protein At3g58530 isoform X3 [Carya illinoinensis]|uniref:F-box protein At3g58530 isoform X3 n=1 Tax=Carya illinoinensis TaxID=32201 RepID=UPI001C727FE3|nr:F-box protein At3g58530 isoform X3 [Carya illinoinensis]